MLAAHRDQENLAYSHQIPTKQAPKTPGLRYPKTPSRFGQRDENALAGKSLVNGVNIITPTVPQTRAVLGNKTTNAKARTGQSKTGGVKDAVKEVEKSQIKQSSIRKLRQKQASSRKLFLTAQRESGPDYDEPEYAPPRPKPLPYQSDVLPDGGLTFEGLKKENFFKGYYQHFINPLDSNGRSRMEKLLDGEMVELLENAMQRNKTETDKFSWNADDIDVSEASGPDASRSNNEQEFINDHLRIATERNMSTMSSRRGGPSLANTPMTSQSKISQYSAKKLPISKERLIPSAIGDDKSRPAPSTKSDCGETDSSRHARATRTIPIFTGEDARIAKTPSRLPEADDSQLHSSSMYAEIHDDMDLPLMDIPFEDSDSDEEFEMKLDSFMF